MKYFYTYLGSGHKIPGYIDSDIYQFAACPGEIKIEFTAHLILSGFVRDITWGGWKGTCQEDWGNMSGRCEGEMSGRWAGRGKCQEDGGTC